MLYYYLYLLVWLFTVFYRSSNVWYLVQVFAHAKEKIQKISEVWKTWKIKFTIYVKICLFRDEFIMTLNLVRNFGEQTNQKIINKMCIFSSEINQTFCLSWRSSFVTEVWAWCRWGSVVCYGRVWLGKDWVGRAVMKGENVVGPDMFLNTLRFLIKSNINVRSLPAMLPPELYRKFLWVEKIWEWRRRRRSQPRVSWALESLGTVQISKRYLTAFFKYLCETWLHITQKWYTHCAGIISNWNLARPF